jgi:hypothetical protein
MTETIRVHQPGPAKAGDRLTLGRRYVSPAMTGAWIPHIDVLRSDIEISA